MESQRGRLSGINEFTLRLIESKPVKNRPINKEKLKNIQEQMRFIPATFQGFYKTLTANTDSEFYNGDSDTDGDIPLSHFVQEGPSSRPEVNIKNIKLRLQEIRDRRQARGNQLVQENSHVPVTKKRAAVSKE